MRIIKKHRLASVSPWVLAAACGLLAVIIAVFAVNNYRRDKALMTDILLEKGVTLIRFVASSSRSSIITGLRSGQDLAALWPGNVQRVLEHAAGHPGVRFLALVDNDGFILANSVPAARIQQVSKQTHDFLLAIDADASDTRTFNYRISTEDKGSVFQVAAYFSPITSRLLEQFSPQVMKNNSEGMGNRVMRLHGSNSTWKKRIESLSQKKYMILVELDMKQYNKRLQRQKLEIIILSIVLLLVGFGGWLSILTLEGLKGSQSRLRRVEAFRDILISSLPVGLIATDSKGQIVLYNKFSEELTGISEKIALGNNTGVFAKTEAIRSILDASGERRGVISQREVQLINAQGTCHTVQLNRMAIVDRDNQFVGILLMIQDLSQVKKLEKDLRRSERLAALGKMAAGVAHELRNPLSSIKGLALVLRSKFCIENNDRETANILVQEVERLNRSISELLDYARPQELQKSEFDLHALLQKSVSLLSIDAEAAGVEIVLDFPETLSPIYADEDRLSQVFLNLFLNSIQAMSDGGTLSVRSVKSGDVIVITVTDSGCGISSENLGRVFDPYFTTKPEGTGLGMAMSAKIVEEHGGSMVVDSKEGKGTSVVIEIPC
ncbi:PAS domain S-box [Desulfocapsa sulfexigens DSM 10523]|uniref:histidine kinase n=1 Tax=Desulfocapsa sulfexigens (strain DSM 10523 / SB164P1) TaxID=1167006 RepID=M1PJG8_DESSD|nr:ATP-binding protein [Desulfocapsa sulfexigens]AGF79710.1 PAS domain S-box [Desulfocapsa sulfexigens DSM 10523]